MQIYVYDKSDLEKDGRIFCQMGPLVSIEERYSYSKNEFGEMGTNDVPGLST